MESLKLLSQAALQMVRFGPLLNARVGYNSVAALPQGLVAAGAACSATTVDNDDAQGQARITAILVRLGYVNFVRDIVVKLCEELERSDVVAAITAALLQLKELDIVRQINDALVFNGHVATGAKIAGEMVSQGYTEMGDIAAQQVAESAKPGGMLNKLKETGQQALDAVSTDGQKQARREEQERAERRQEAERQADAAQQSVLGGLAQSARDMLQGVSGTAGRAGDQASARADEVAAHNQAPSRAL